MIEVKNYKKEAVIQYCKPSKRAMQKYRNHIVFQAEFHLPTSKPSQTATEVALPATSALVC
jgi:hypothetical protein